MTVEQIASDLLLELRAANCGRMPWEFVRATKAIEDALHAARAEALREAANDDKGMRRAGISGLGRLVIKDWLRARALEESPREQTKKT